MAAEQEELEQTEAGLETSLESLERRPALAGTKRQGWAQHLRGQRVRQMVLVVGLQSFKSNAESLGS